MKKPILIGLLFILGLGLLGYWFLFPVGQEITVRLPIPENAPKPEVFELDANTNQGTLIPGKGLPSQLKDSWPQFRGRHRNAVAGNAPIASTWAEGGPRVQWKVQVGEGHAGAAIHQGRVYLLDYDEDKKEDVIRCLSLDNGEEIWKYTYYVKIKRNHGMSRTVPGVNDRFVVTLGPKCHVYCLNAASGEQVWMKNLVSEYKTKIPEWYAGQCPLIEDDRVILAPGGTCLMTAVDLATGETIWETPNEDKWNMTHSSILPIEFEGQLQYVWSASGGAVGVSAETGEILWKFPEWKVKIANIPSPIDLGQGRIFFCGGYNTGGVMCRLARKDGAIQAEPSFRTKAKLFGSDQQTPIYYNNYIYGVIPGGKLACLSPEGDRLWVNEEYNFGLGPYLMIDDKLLVLDDDHNSPGGLSLFKIGPNGLQKLAAAEVLAGHDAWAPIAYASGLVILRDLTSLICLNLKEDGA